MAAEDEGWGREWGVRVRGEGWEESSKFVTWHGSVIVICFCSWQESSGTFHGFCLIFFSISGSGSCVTLQDSVLGPSCPISVFFFSLPPSGQKSRSTTPPISNEILFLKDKFRLQSNTVHVFQREICRNDTFKRLLKTLLRVLFTNKGEILAWKSVTPCKNRKNSRAYYTKTRDKSG